MPIQSYNFIGSKIKDLVVMAVQTDCFYLQIVVRHLFGPSFPSYLTIQFVNLFQMSPSTFNLLQTVVFLQIIVLVTAYNGDRFCGSELTKMLQLACRGKYYSPRSSNQDKRSGKCDYIVMMIH